MDGRESLDSKPEKPVFVQKDYTNKGELKMSFEEAVRQVARAMQAVEYGEIIVKMQGGKPIWVDKYERKRVG